MRNVLEFPLTLHELNIALDIAVEEQAKLEYVGDITATCLHLVRDYVRAHPEIGRAILESDPLYAAPRQAATT